MRMLTSCTLIGFSPDAHEVGTDPVSARRTVRCQEMALTLTEVYQSGGEGLSPDAKLLIPYDRDYKGERALEYRGEPWIVLRADPYKDWNGVLLSIRRVKGNSSTWAPPAEPATTETVPAEVG